VASTYRTSWVKRLRNYWPRPTEIAAQYLTILVRSIVIDGMLKVPRGAGERLPDQVAAMLGVAIDKPLEPLAIFKADIPTQHFFKLSADVIIERRKLEKIAAVFADRELVQHELAFPAFVEKAFFRNLDQLACSMAV
jgi:hypothetical protein